MTAPPVTTDSMGDQDLSPFFTCRVFLEQLGYLSWDKSRETHKIAVIYIAEGQEDKVSIFANQQGSKAYELFVSRLGWEISLDSHKGFMGRLPSDIAESVPYLADSTTEVTWHVATRMSAQKDVVHKKMVHIGNDQVYIVWSEHTRDYRKEILKTEFADVIIAIYPLPNSLFRIEIIKKDEVCDVGPLFSGAVIHEKILAGLVRATAINASRLCRATGDMHFFHSISRDERLRDTINRYRKNTIFEEFASETYAPALPAVGFVGHSDSHHSLAEAQVVGDPEQRTPHHDFSAPADFVLYQVERLGKSVRRNRPIQQH